MLSRKDHYSFPLYLPAFLAQPILANPIWISQVYIYAVAPSAEKPTIGICHLETGTKDLKGGREEIHFKPSNNAGQVKRYTQISSAPLTAPL
jgi:hypothetical protein